VVYLSVSEMPNMNKKKKEIRNYDKEKNQIMSAYVFDLA